MSYGGVALLASPIPPPFASREDALHWLLELVDKVDAARVDCNVTFPDEQARTRAHQRRAYRRYLMAHGQALGVAMALFRAGLIETEAYNQLTARVRASLLPSVVSRSGGRSGQ